MKRRMLLASFRQCAPRRRRLAHRTFRQGLAVATAGLAFVGSAAATDLMVNGSFEADGDAFADTPGTPTGWTGFLKTYANGTDLFSEGPSIPATENPGGHYTWQHRAVNGANGDAGVPQVTQRVDLTGGVSAADLDAGQGQYTFSGWLASYGQPNQNPEQPLLTVQFFRADLTQIGSTVSLDRTRTNYWVGNAGVSGIIPPSAPGVVTPNQDNHHWAKYQRTGLIPAGARSAVVGIGRSVNSDLGGSPDTYVDLVKFDVVKCLEQCTPETTTILAQPQSRTVFVGFKASFSVLAAGGDPLTYQWVHNNQPINGATDAMLSLSNVQPSAAGTYAVIITGAGGTTNSANATLTVNPVPPCDLSPGLVVHIAFDGDYTDQAGYGVVGEPLGTGTIDPSLPTFAAGKLGQAVHLVNSRDLTTNAVVRLGPGYPDVLKFGSDATSDTTDFSISFWLNFTHNTDAQAFISNKNWDSANNFGLVIASQDNGGFKWNLRDNGGSGRRDSPNVSVIRDGTWHSMIMVFARRGNVISYLDGEVVDVTSMAPSGSPVGSLDTADQGLNWYIGTDGRGAYTGGNAAEIDMLFDDLGIWRRQLTASEVACIYSSGQAGTALPSLGPKLQLKDLGQGDWQVFWAPSITGYILQSSPTLGPSAVWSEESTPANSLRVGTHDPSAPIKFFRLKKSP